MKAASISEIKNELSTLGKPELLAVCLRLAKFKKDNKELLNYLLFEANNLDAYIISVKEEMAEGFSSVHKTNLFFAKKTIRKVLRIANKHIKYTASKQAEIEILIAFCGLLKQTGHLKGYKNVMHNLYAQQVKKINAALHSLHEDLQYDYRERVEAL
jgi:hypothetical protein